MAIIVTITSDRAHMQIIRKNKYNCENIYFFDPPPRVKMDTSHSNLGTKPKEHHGR